MARRSACDLAQAARFGRGEPHRHRAHRAYYSVLSTQYSRLTTHDSRLTTHDSRLTTHYSLLATHQDALLLFNGGDATADITAVWTRDVPESAAGHEEPVPPEAPCLDKAELREACKGWATGGECVKNAGYMRSS